MISETIQEQNKWEETDQEGEAQDKSSLTETP